MGVLSYRETMTIPYSAEYPFTANKPYVCFWIDNQFSQDNIPHIKIAFYLEGSELSFIVYNNTLGQYLVGDSVEFKANVTVENLYILVTPEYIDESNLTSAFVLTYSDGTLDMIQITCNVSNLTYSFIPLKQNIPYNNLIEFYDYEWGVVCPFIRDTSSIYIYQGNDTFSIYNNETYELIGTYPLDTFSFENKQLFATPVIYHENNKTYIEIYYQASDGDFCHQQSNIYLQGDNTIYLYGVIQLLNDKGYFRLQQNNQSYFRLPTIDHRFFIPISLNYGALTSGSSITQPWIQTIYSDIPNGVTKNGYRMFFYNQNGVKTKNYLYMRNLNNDTICFYVNEEANYLLGRFYNGKTKLQERYYIPNETPVYYGSTPTKPSTAQYDYVFKGRRPSISAITTDTDYYAEFNSITRSYDVKFVDYNGTILKTISIEYGSKVSEEDIPIISITNRKGYTFTGFTPNPLTTTITGETTFTATYTEGLAINLFKNTSENNRVDKTDYLESIGTLYGFLREETSIINPTIRITRDYIDFNYVEIPIMNRYYFVNEVKSIRTDLWEISLTCDTLMSYKDEILSLECYVARNEFEFDEYIEDTALPLKYDKTVTITTPTTPTILKNTQFDQGYSFFATTIYDTTQGDSEITLTTYPSGNGVIQPISSYIAGNTSFKTYNLFFNTPDDLYSTENEISMFARMLINDEVLASYVQSFVSLPISKDTITNIWMQNGGLIQSSGIRIKDASKSSQLWQDFPMMVYWPRKCGILPPLENARFGINSYFNNFLDYEPYTKYEIYLPYYGYVEVNSYDILNCNLSVIYMIQPDSTDSTVYIVNNTKNNVIFSGPCSLGTQIGISTTNSETVNRQAQANTLNMIMGSIIGVGTMGFGMASGHLTSTSIGGSMLLGSISQGISHAMTLRPSAKTTIGSGVNSAFSPKRVSLRITRPQLAVDDLTKYAKLVGRPLQENKVLSTLRGYTIVGGLHVENISLATELEKNEIERKLRQGVIL